MLCLILYLALFIGLISFFIHGVYSCYKFRKEEQNRRLNDEEKQREYKKRKMMNEIQSYLKVYPELKEELLNN